MSSISFSSPESDFSRPTAHEIAIAGAHARQYNSTSLSFATPHADFVGPSADQILMMPTQRSSAVFNSQVSFATPYADFVAAVEHEMEATSAADEHPTTISFGTPFSDFSAPTPCHVMSAPQRTMENSITAKALAHDTNITFSSPFSDFVAAHSDGHEGLNTEKYDMAHITYGTPFSDFVAPSAHHILEAPEMPEEDTHPHISYSTALADFTAPHAKEVLAPVPDVVHHDVAHISFSTPYSDMFSHGLHSETSAPTAEAAEDKAEAAFFAQLPREVNAALSSSAASQQARVITEARPPFRITYVNDAWVGLCGFSSQEAVGNSLSILQGHRTAHEELQRIHQQTIDRQLDQMSFNLINYKKNGNEFSNHLRIVPLRGKNNEVTHFLGVLEDAAQAMKA